LTLSTLSKNPVLSSFIATDFDNPTWNDHVKMGLSVDVILIAPATSNTISSMAHGRCNNLLLAVYLSAKCPVFIAPAMDLDMYNHPSNQKNIEILKSFGNYVFPVGEGQLASGLEGKGRMLEPEEIVNNLITFFNPKLPLKGKSVLVTAGPTHEAIDPVRFIGNHASGKMGFALAEEAARLGAKVILISGPSIEKINNSSVSLTSVDSAEMMFKEVKRYYPKVDIAIAAAAVSDYKPVNYSNEKIKKTQDHLSLKLSPTLDILSYMGKEKKKQCLIGFALETENELVNAKEKLKNKNLDGIVLNSMKDEGAGFSVNTNKVQFIKADLTVKKFPLLSKLECAGLIFKQILSL